MLFILLSGAVAAAQELPPLSYSANIAGSWIAGNLDQVQLNANAQLNIAGPRFSNDLVFSGYQLWSQVVGVDGLTRIGDDIAISMLPTVSLQKNVLLFGVGHYSYSQLHQIDGRGLAGVAIGAAPKNNATSRVRIGLGAMGERTAYPGDVFNRDVQQNGNIRNVARVSVIGDGWYRPSSTPFTIQGLGWFHLNPTDLQDLRLSLDTTIGYRIAGPLSLQLNLNATYSSVVLQGVETVDVRSTVGIGLQPPKEGS